MDYFLKHKSAYTFDLLVKDKILNINVALCVPIQNLALLFNPRQRNILPNNFKEKNNNHTSCHSQKFKYSENIFILKEVFNRFDRDEPRKLCVRFMKYLRSKFITHLKWMEDSYHIKTVFVTCLKFIRIPMTGKRIISWFDYWKFLIFLRAVLSKGFSKVSLYHITASLNVILNVSLHQGMALLLLWII